ncbi:hypothetical protein [Bacillus badius]|uniref:hypothetical protein n=2 Tax=Bacillus badius TaxID=1455 RepID=UPI000596D952|nr:hypothetical protein [Bacillus badius]KZN99329.1 hypothetical protein A4244_19030 [Bacillus badius]MED4717535.1 hypothetical protein [Bacillus badius]OCS84857.1 hypothetical protein A6M11_19045 [Bacillus badius]OVE45996.1 hypothetical protein B1A98_19825 [Bacillus badius]TDV97344.1 hypothetical protein B0G66_1413 [Bacillus badius]
MKKIATVLLSSALLFSPVALNSQTEASTLNQLVPIAPSDSEIGSMQPYGMNPPTSSASTHDISVSTYNYQVSKVGAQVYTDKFIKGKTTMKISVKNWKVLNSHGGTSNSLTLTVYNSSGKKVAGKTITISKGSGSASFSGLSSSTKYYVKFSVPLNSNTYSFNGSIS